MKYDIIFAGVGGQGIVSIASMLVEAAGKEGLHAKQNEVHGMSQRGGAVSCHVRISTEPIWADIIPHGSADFILATEPMEGLRYADFLKADGIIITGNQPVKNIEYPDEQKLFDAIKRHSGAVIVDTAAITAELHNPKAANIAVLGALAKKIGRFQDKIEAIITKKFSSKGEKVVETNIKAFEMGSGA